MTEIPDNIFYNVLVVFAQSSVERASVSSFSEAFTHV